MDKGERRLHASPTPPGESLVRARPVADLLEISFERGFTQLDIDGVKAIRGRKWLPQRLVWTVPHTPANIDALRRAFGSRLRLAEPLIAGSTLSAPLPPPGNAPADDHSNAVIASPAAFQQEADRIVAAMRQALHLREYSRKTEIAYVAWVQRFFRFVADSVAESDQLRAQHANAFLEQLASQNHLAAGSRNQAASAISFMFREILGRDELANTARAKGPKRLPAVLSHREVLRVLRQLTGKHLLVATLLYSAGLRLEESLRLRVKDIDFELRQILVRDGKGKKDRYVPLARRAIDPLRAQIRRVTELHEADRAAGHGWAPLPGALHRKDPEAGYELAWQWVFPATGINTDATTGRTCRWPLHPTAVQRSVKRAVRRAGIPKRATCHTFRHSFATEALRGGCDIRTLQYVMGHKDIRTTMIYLHVVEQTGLYVRSPLDRPDDPEDEELDPVGHPSARLHEHWSLNPGEENTRTHARRKTARRKRRKQPRATAADVTIPKPPNPAPGSAALPDAVRATPARDAE